MKTLYTADIKYEKNSIKTLGKVMNKTVNLPTETMRYIASAALVIVGFYNGGTAGIISVAFGCILFSMRNVIQDWRTGRSVEAMKEGCVEVKYQFLEETFAVESFGQEQFYKYADMIQLVEDEEFYYIFPNKYQAFMMRKKSIHPLNEEDFKRQISDKAQKEWIRVGFVFRDSVRNFLVRLKSKSKK